MVTEHNIERLKAAQRLLVEKFGLDEECVIDIGMQEIDLGFPEDPDARIAVEDFEKLIDELPTFSIVDHSTVTTARISQYVLISDSPLDPEYEKVNLEFNSDKIHIRIVKNPVLIGLAAVQLKLYSEYTPPCSHYNALEITYQTPEDRVPEVEDDIRKSFLFELSHALGEAVLVGKIDNFEFDEEEEKPDKNTVVLTTLEKYTDGMLLYVRALETLDEEISFLYYYKILEFYSPFVARKNSFEKIRRKIDGIRYSHIDSADIKSIVALTTEYNRSQTDKELAKIVIRECVDLVENFNLLPEGVRKRMAKECSFNRDEFNYSLGEERIAKACDALGSILYSTRNSIVHAKSNYESDSNECDEKELPDMNDFLKKVTYSVITWYSRLPKHLK